MTTAVPRLAPTSWTTSAGDWPRPTPTSPPATPEDEGHQAAGPHRLCPGRPADPRNVLVDGHHVVWDGRLLGADMDTPRRDRARRLWREDAR
ncbi:MAG: hypothetical protein ACJ75K_11245 [Actinomycetes bacterium]